MKILKGVSLISLLSQILSNSVLALIDFVLVTDYEYPTLSNVSACHNSTNERLYARGLSTTNEIQLWALNDKSSSWTLVSRHNVSSTSRTFGDLCVAKDTYVIANNTLWELNYNSLLEERYDYCVGVGTSATRIFVFGGKSKSNGTILKDLWAIDTRRNTRNQFMINNVDITSKRCITFINSHNTLVFVSDNLDRVWTLDMNALQEKQDNPTENFQRTADGFLVLYFTGLLITMTVSCVILIRMLMLRRKMNLSVGISPQRSNIEQKLLFETIPRRRADSSARNLWPKAF